MSARRPAQIIADTVNVCCPYCGEPQPAPDNGSDMWTPQMVREEAARESRRTCVSCDEAFSLFARTTAQIAHVHVPVASGRLP